MRMKQLSVAATTGVMWYVVRMSKVLALLQSWYGASPFKNRYQSEKKRIYFRACHSGELKLAFTSPDAISILAPKTF